ncbi:hypothetical protein GOP47_0024768 [Adiantum capillus-veneris]|uniref:Uncharacterized protein n=1 Tax=Adiantum capillus-veneris TaxID=13818 RepID=A0A9D4U3L8_ADICA|nr:hypothetical protein GOP47_0024768 [Adiantum capillus-veneris]
MLGEQEIVELRSASDERRVPASSLSPTLSPSASLPRSRSSATILLRSSSRVIPNGETHAATEIKEAEEKVRQAQVGKHDGTAQKEISIASGTMATGKGGTQRHTTLGRIKQASVNEDGTHWDSKMRHESAYSRDLGMWRSSVVELMATLVLTFTSVAAVIACLRADFSYPRISVAITQFLIYTMCIVAAAPLSGGHLNPSFSFACILIGHISPLRGLLYIVAQSAGSVLGALFVRAAVPSDVAQMYYLGGCLLKQQVVDANLNTISSVGADSGPALVAELFFSFLLIAVALPLLILCPTSRCPAPAWRGQPSRKQNFTSFMDPALLRAAFIIGLLLGLLIFVSGQLLSPGYTSAGMNPARCFGPAVAEGGADLWRPQWVFWLGPFLAALLFAVLYGIIFYNHPYRRSYEDGRYLAHQDHNGEAKLPLVGVSENPASRVDELRQTSIQMPALPHGSLLTDPIPKRMDVFLHIKATMQPPDRSTADECDKSVHPFSTKSPLAVEASASIDDQRHFIVDHANLSLRHLMELPSTSSNSTTLKLEKLLKDTEES